MIFDKVLSRVKEVPSSRNYWLVRTMGGMYYDEFISYNYIAIGYNEIPISVIKDSSTLDNPNKHLTALIDDTQKHKSENERYNSSRVAGQLLTFCTKISQDDIVIIPSRSGLHKVCIGIVTKTVYDFIPQSKDENVCQFSKRIGVKWIGEYMRYQLNPYLQKAFNSQNTVNDINKYADYIESLINDFYIKDDVANLTLRARQDNQIPLDAFTLPHDILDLVEEFCAINNIEFDRNDFVMKVLIQSRGDFRIACKIGIPLIIFGAFVNALCGGGKIKYKDFEFDAGNGIMPTVNDFLDRKQAREIAYKESDIKNKKDSLEYEKQKYEFEKQVRKDSIEVIQQKLETLEIAPSAQINNILSDNDTNQIVG